MEFMKSTPLRSSSRSEARHEETGRAARDIIAHDAAVRAKNTERLKAARLAPRCVAAAARNPRGAGPEAAQEGDVLKEAVLDRPARDVLVRRFRRNGERARRMTPARRRPHARGRRG